MYERIIEQMSNFVDGIMRQNQTDFTKYDMELLADYNGEFIWLVAPTHTHLHKISAESLKQMVATEGDLYNLLQGNSWVDAYLNQKNEDERIFIFDGRKLLRYIRDDAKRYWRSLKKWALFQWQVEHGMEPLPSDFTIPVEFIECEDYFNEQLEYAKAHNDTSLQDCIDRFNRRIKQGGDHKIVIFRDYTERSFLFREMYGGKSHLCGGIIFHGYPDEGYRVNDSIQLSPSYGWSTHT